MEDSAPPTMIRRPGPPVPAAAQPALVPAVAPPQLIEHAGTPLRGISTPTPDESAPLKLCIDELTRERDHLRTELAQLRQETESLRATQSQLQAQLAERPETAPLQNKQSPSPASQVDSSIDRPEALRLTGELGDLLEQASHALKSGDSSRAGALIRDASFSLADFRDLCQTERS